MNECQTDGRSWTIYSKGYLHSSRALSQSIRHWNKLRLHLQWLPPSWFDFPTLEAWLNVRVRWDTYEKVLRDVWHVVAVVMIWGSFFIDAHKHKQWCPKGESAHTPRIPWELCYGGGWLVIWWWWWCWWWWQCLGLLNFWHCHCPVRARRGGTAWTNNEEEVQLDNGNAKTKTAGKLYLLCVCPLSLFLSLALFQLFIFAVHDFLAMEGEYSSSF